MKHKGLIILSIIFVTVVAVIIACNVVVIHISKGKCYDDIGAIPHRTYGVILGTGRSAAPSPYYDARVQAAIELYQAGKIDYIIVSGENLYDDYNEVDSMVLAMEDAGVPVVMVDYEGRDTYSSLMNYGRSLGFRNPSLTVISQPFHNQRAVFYGTRLFNKPIVAYNAQDTNIWYWKIWSFAREVLARTKAVVLVHFRN
ncbi:MAG: YdcF family protein [Paludibacteraceae bacterium]|nr:YdcF family protein [Paludibacteraceae bacterium]